MSPVRRLEGSRAYGRASDAFETIAWKAPTAARFQNQVANDAPAEPTLKEMIRGVPAWAVAIGGALVAALTGALLGDMMRL